MVDAAIALRGVSCAYDGASALRDVSLHIPAGRFVGVIGPSGAGKTTLLRAMLGGVPRVRGEVVVGGRAVRPGRPPADVGYVPQVEAVDWHFPVTVADVVLMGRIRRMGWLPWPNRADRNAVGEVLERLGLGGLARRQIRELSGGQQQRVFLARALIGRPPILLLDEPTASVDIGTREDLLRHFAALNQEGVTVVVTTHELNAVAARLPWVICVNGGVVAEGPPAEVFTAAMLSQTFGTPMRVVRDPETGELLVAEGGRDDGPERWAGGGRRQAANGGEPVMAEPELLTIGGPQG